MPRGYKWLFRQLTYLSEKLIKEIEEDEGIEDENDQNSPEVTISEKYSLAEMARANSAQANSITFSQPRVSVDSRKDSGRLD